MECNRDEAIRAKSIAEKKIDDKDYAGAKKFTMKAQTLYPDLEGISQMLVTINVYMSFENKVSGESDWYGVLGVTPSDDDETMRKKYRKLALILHPDKNKSAGADGAFQILSEAWRLLSDKDKRLAYNQRRNLRGFREKVSRTSSDPGVNGMNSFAKKPTPKPKSQNSTTSKQTHVPNNGSGPGPGPGPAANRVDSFWTVCSNCKMNHEYTMVYLNQTILCANCRKPFTAVQRPAPSCIPKPAQSSCHRFQKSSNHAAKRKAPSGSSSCKNASGHCSSRTKDPFVASKAADVLQQVRDRLRRDSEGFYAQQPQKKAKR